MAFAAALMQVGAPAAHPDSHLSYAPGAESDADDIAQQNVDRAIDKAVAFLKADQRRDGQWIDPELDKRHPNAITALAAYTLRTAGTPPSDWRLQRVAAAFKDRSNTRTVLARACTLLMWCALDPVRYKREIDEDVQFLDRKQLPQGGWGDGVPSATDSESPQPLMDTATTQLVLSALAEAASAGARVNTRTWRREEDGWIERANPDGGWGFLLTDNSNPAKPIHASNGCATAAALASLYTIYDQRHLDSALKFNGRFKARCGEEIEETKPIRIAIHRGWQWMEEYFRPDRLPDSMEDNDGIPSLTSLPYYSYVVFRAGLASGRKRIGPHVGYHEVAEQLIRTQKTDGSWGGIYDTCFGILALLHVRTPVIVNELVVDPEIVWHADPRAAANLTRWLHRRSGTPVTWQSVRLDTHPDDVLDAPVLLITGHAAPQLDEVQRAALRNFVSTGGTIFGVACCSRPEFVEQCRELFSQILPQLTYGPIPPGHPVWILKNAVEAGEDLLGFEDGCRTSIFLLHGPACCAWQQNLIAQHERFFTLAENVVAYATFGRSSAGRLTPYIEQPKSPTRSERVLTIGRLKHRGDWWIDEPVLKRLSAILSKRIGVTLEEKPPVRAPEARQSEAAVLWLTGHTFEPFQAAGQVELKAYLAAGGTLVASACCGREPFDASFQAFAATLWGKDAWQRIDINDPLMMGSMAPGLIGPLDQLSFRERYDAPPPGRPDWPILYGVKRDDRWVLIYSPYDITCGIAGHNCLNCVGYRPPDAEMIAANVMLYVADKTQGATKVNGTTPETPEPNPQTNNNGE